MGGYPSSGQAEGKGTTETFEMIRNSLREDLANHGACVKAMQASINGHARAIDVFIVHLTGIVDNARERDTRERRMLQLAEEYRDSIKEGLANQSASLTGSLDHITVSLDRIISDDVSQTLASSTSRLSKLEHDNQKLKRDCSILQEQNITLKKDNESKQTDINNMNWRLNVLNREQEELKGELKELKGKYERERRELQQSLRRKRELEDEVSSLKDKVYRLEQARRVQKVSVPIQLYCERRDELMMRVMDELTAMLVTQMSTNNIELGFTRCDRREDIQRDKLLLVLCINASRIGTDAGNAIAGIPQPDRTALLVLHHKSMHALPNQSSDRMLTTSEFKSLGGIFDMAFLADKGIYTCDMNNAAVNGILNFVKSRSPSSS